jgi:hypothetical protein
MSVSLKSRPELKFWANSSSPLKWTELPSQSSLEDFRYQPGVLTPGGLLRQVQDLSFNGLKLLARNLFQGCL